MSLVGDACESRGELPSPSAVARRRFAGKRHEFLMTAAPASRSLLRHYIADCRPCRSPPTRNMRCRDARGRASRLVPSRHIASGSVMSRARKHRRRQPSSADFQYRARSPSRLGSPVSQASPNAAIVAGNGNIRPAVKPETNKAESLTTIDGGCWSQWPLVAGGHAPSGASCRSRRGAELNIAGARAIRHRSREVVMIGPQLVRP